MSDPLWLRSAALTATLAGLTPDEAVRGFEELDGQAIGRCARAMASAAASEGIARVAARERADGLRGRADEAGRARRGARVLAAWLRTLRPEERARWTRALEPTTLKLALDGAVASAGVRVDTRALHGLVARVSEALGRPPTAVELGGVVDGWFGDDRGVPSSLARVARSARVSENSWPAALAALCADEGST